MYKLKYADYEGKYHGFTLKPGYFYGTDTETGCYIATSGWECAGNVAIYFLETNEQEKEKQSWKMHWIDTDLDFEFSNLPDVDYSKKMIFPD